MTRTLARLAKIALVWLWSACASAAGWNDFALDIGHGFEISRFNALQVCLGRTDGGQLLICPDLREGAHGPVVGYAFTDRHLLIRTLGARPSPHIEGSYVPDPDAQHFFILGKSTKDGEVLRVLGPVDQSAFRAQAGVPEAVQWVRPTNPDAGSALLGLVVFAGFAALVFGWPVMLLVLAVGVFLLFRRTRAVRREKRRGEA